MKRSLHFGRRGGQTIILVVAMSIFVMAALGLAVDGAEMYAQRQMAQAAADASAQAGMMSIFRGTNATSADPFGTGATPIASFTCTTTDSRTPCVYARDNGFGGTLADTVTLSFPASVSGVTLSSGATVPALGVSVQRTLKNGLIRFVVPTATSSVTARATAGLIGAVSPDCVYVLDPSASGAFTANNGANVAVSGCSIAVSSDSPTAAILSATVTATALDIVGGCSCSQTYPTLVTAPSAPADPFLSLPAPSIGACLHSSMYSPPNNTTIPGGNYCGGITVSNGVSGVTFATNGVFVITGGGLTFGGGITSSGSGVMFYLTGTNATYGSVTIANGVSLTFSGPTSGVYQGVLFFQDRTITSANNATFEGGASMQLTGSLYFPTTDVAFGNGSNVAAYSTAIVAKQVSFVGGTSIKYDPTGTKTGLFSKSVALVQ